MSGRCSGAGVTGDCYPLNTGAGNALELCSSGPAGSTLNHLSSPNFYIFLRIYNFPNFCAYHDKNNLLAFFSFTNNWLLNEIWQLFLEHVNIKGLIQTSFLTGLTHFREAFLCRRFCNRGPL